MNQTSGNGRIARNVGVVATALALWSALVFLFATPLALTGPISWEQAVSFGVSFWALWFVFLPAVAWLSFHFPIQRKSLLRHIAIHVIACLAIVAANRIASRAYTRFSLAPPRSEAPARARDASAAAPAFPDQAPGRPPRSAESRPRGSSTPGAFGVFLGLRAALDVLVYWSLFAFCQAITNFRRSQERERRAVELEASLTKAKLQALRMQINPHFLFNTLNSIAALIYDNPRAADEMLGDLSALLRRSLDSMEEQEVPLAHELDFIAAYIAIEQKRFGDRLQLEQSVPAELMKALVPALILQPLVENAIRHGIEPRRGPGVISIVAKQDGQHLQLVICDNGRGLRSSDGSSSARHGIGLANIQARLQGLYGRDHSFSIGKTEPEGCRVEIRLPLHMEPVEVRTSVSPAAA